MLILLSMMYILSVSGLNFSIGQVGECDPLSLSWSGGLSPFQLLIIPPGGTMANISIPASAYNNSSRHGSYTLPQLKLKEEQQFMLSMSDATGMFAGGTSSLLSVGASQGGQKCNTTFPDPDFTFSLGSTLAQCSPFPVTLYPGPVTPVLPVRLLVNIPQGNSFVVTLPRDLSSWIANLTARTPAAFTVIDARNKNGGTEVLRVAQATNNTSCLVSSFTPTTTASASPTAATKAEPQKNTIALAVGISIGGFGILCIALIFFWCHSRRRLHASRPRSLFGLSDNSVDPDSSYHMINLHTRASNTQSKPTRPSTGKTTLTAESRGTSASVYTPRNVGHIELHPSSAVMHRDITETTRPQAIEFPPQYSANLPPIPSTLLHDLTNGQRQARKNRYVEG